MATRDEARRVLPRVDRPELDRVRIGLLLYADQIRAHDIAAVTKLPMSRLLAEAKAIRLPLLSELSDRRSLPLLDLCKAVVDGAAQRDLVDHFGITWASAGNIVSLVLHGEPPRGRLVEDPVIPLHRCQTCTGLSRHESHCIYCGGAW